MVNTGSICPRRFVKTIRSAFSHLHEETNQSLSQNVTPYLKEEPTNISGGTASSRTHRGLLTRCDTPVEYSVRAMLDASSGTMCSSAMASPSSRCFWSEDVRSCGSSFINTSRVTPVGHFSLGKTPDTRLLCDILNLGGDNKQVQIRVEVDDVSVTVTRESKAL